MKVKNGQQLKAFIFKWEEDSDGMLSKHSVVIIQTQPKKARENLLKWLRRHHSEWRAPDNEDIIEDAEMKIKKISKTGVLFYDTIFMN